MLPAFNPIKSNLIEANPSKELSDGRFWWGISLSASNHVYVAGSSYILGGLFEVSGAQRRCYFQADHWRFGPGLGGSGGTSLLIGLNLRSPNDLRAALGGSVAGWEFSVGLNSKALIRASTLDLVRKLDASDFLARKSKDVASLQRISHDIAHVFRGRDFLEAYGSVEKPTLITLPIEYGFQASAYFAIASKVEVLEWA